jgi:hypothetical protein
MLLETRDEVFLILPLNVAAAMPEQLEPFQESVWKELELYLRAHGKDLKTLSLPAARGLWADSIRRVRAGQKGGRAGFEDAARVLALEIRDEAQFDAMIVPSLFIREAAIENRSASWDGVERALELRTRGPEPRSLVEMPLEGAAPGASLHVAVFDAKGDKLHEALGGLELLVAVRTVGRNLSGVPTFQFTPRTALFENREQLREGINAAFAPFLRPLPDY